MSIDFPNESCTLSWKVENARREDGENVLKIPCTMASSSASSVQKLGNNKPWIEVARKPSSTVVLLFLKSKDG